MTHHDSVLDKAEEVTQTLKEFKALKKANQELDRLERGGSLIYNLLEVTEGQITKARFLATERADDAYDSLRNALR